MRTIGLDISSRTINPTACEKGSIAFMQIEDIMKKSHDGGVFSREELITCLNYPPHSAATYRLMAEANRISRQLSGDKAEVHAQFALNLAPCPRNCLFCSFAETNGIFHEDWQITPEEAQSCARQLEDEGANAIFIMTTAHYPFGQFLEIAQEVKKT
jgi:biotin synthase